MFSLRSRSGFVFIEHQTLILLVFYDRSMNVHLNLEYE